MLQILAQTTIMLQILAQTITTTMFQVTHTRIQTIAITMRPTIWQIIIIMDQEVAFMEIH